MNQEKFSFLKSTMSPMLMKTAPRDKSVMGFFSLGSLDFTVDTITFRYRGAHSQSLYNRDLRLENRTGVRIFFKIKSNSPQNYEVLPFEEYIENGKSLEIRFKLNVSGTNISKYNVDRFRVEWGKYDENEGRYCLTERCTLKVKMETEMAEDEKVEEEGVRGSNDQEKALKEMLDKNLKEIKRIGERIEALEEENSKEFEFSKSLLAMAALLSFLVGYWLG